ncbi:MAG: tetratricopeptide repeat protein [Spirochaetes bacterium]|jgi:tetratricopeptide (TPR) repeat protein|nr:tetratricopeptide repeat protein [Spirochaetota bacterium]
MRRAISAGLVLFAAYGTAVAQKGPALRDAPPSTVERREPPAGAGKDASTGEQFDRKLMLEYQRDVDMARIRRAHLLDRTAEMERLLRDFSGKYPTDKDREYHYYTGLVLSAAGEYRRAVESFLKAIEIAPDYARARNSLGALYCRLNKYHFALVHFRKALEINPYNPFLQYNLGSLYFEIGDPANARVHLENAVKYKANFGNAYHRLGVLAFQTQQYERTIEYMAKAIEFRTESHTTHYYTGMSYFSLEKGSMALASLRKALQIKPDFFEAAFDLARVHHSYGEFANALEFYRKADALNPDYPEIKLAIVECLRELKRYREGVALVRQLLERDPQNERLRRYLKNLQDQRLIENLAEPYDYFTY